MSSRIVVEKNEWDRVYKDLENEVIKTSTYDDCIIQLIGDVKNKRILDYGGGPGVIAKALKDLGANVDIYDNNERILKMANNRLSSKNIMPDKNNIPQNTYDFALCNLVVCIVEDDEVVDITKDIYNALHKEGSAFVGFCNPKIYNVHESKLDIRHSGNINYEENHEYLKEKKEGGYIVPEKHRPLEWYSKIFEEAGFLIKEISFTPEYVFKEKAINDFVIYTLKK
ncbi:MAG: class I SAM-dependent methyltransferase [Dysgonamonadaceae bacterium]|jgi:2-polyprenyl-3-methyl-5-hydroxy-6-metoxy-1,4-benzoquinol methylase|nr:class I SAM-dependent methyltransferase [Dysgonamonadaceae bacterium]